MAEAAAAVAAAAPPAVHSLLRYLVPFRLVGAGPVASFHQSAFVHREPLIHGVLRSLEGLPTSMGPRAAFAEAFQQLLEGRVKQRDLRDAFQGVEVQCRRELNEEKGTCAFDPLYRLYTHELTTAATYYADMFGVGADPSHNALVKLRSAITQDIRKDGLFTDVFAAFADSERREIIPPEYHLFIAEEFHVERDTFGQRRFDTRPGGQLLIHTLLLSDVTTSAEARQVLDHPLTVEHGNVVRSVTPFANGRWLAHELCCGPEDHRLMADGSSDDRIRVSGDGWSHEVRIQYDQPLASYDGNARLYAPTPPQVFKFEAAVPQKRTFLEKYFLDR